MFHPRPSETGVRLTDAFIVTIEAECPCGEKTGVLSRLAFDFDSMTLDTPSEQIRRLVDEPKIDCGSCKAKIQPGATQKVVLVYEFEDGLGTVLARASKSGGWVAEYAFRRGGASELADGLSGDGNPMEDADWHPALTNELCFRELKRVFSIRSRWVELLRTFQKRRKPILERLSPGMFAAVYSPETREEYEGIFEATPLGPMAVEKRSASVRLNGLDTWEPDKRAPLEPGSCREWLPKDLHRELAEGLMVAEIAIEIDEILAATAGLARKRGLTADRLDDEPAEARPFDPAESEDDDDDEEGEGLTWAVRLSNTTGFHSTFRPELVFVKSVYQCRTLGESVAVEMLESAEPLARIDRTVAFLREKLPPEATFAIEEGGIAKVTTPEGRPQMLNLPSLVAKFDVEDAEDAARLLRVATTGRQCDCAGYVGKKLKTKGWLDAATQNLIGSAAPPTHLDRRGFVQVYSYECDHDSRYSPEIGGGDEVEAEQMFLRDAAKHVWRVVVETGTVGSVLERPVLVAIGPNAASLALHGGFLRALVTATGVAIEGAVQVFAPISGMCVIAPKGAKREELQEFAWRVFSEKVAKYYPQIAGEELQYWDVVSLPVDGMGRVIIEKKGPK